MQQGEGEVPMPCSWSLNLALSLLTKGGEKPPCPKIASPLWYLVNLACAKAGALNADMFS